MNSSVWKFMEIVAANHQVGPVIEFGSLQIPWMKYGQALAMPDLREFFPGIEYIGCDLKTGPGVDVVYDILDDRNRSCLHVDDGKAKTVIALETLEHCENPFKAVESLKRLVAQDGVIVLSTPFSHPIHQMPDYWRFTPQGMWKLLDTNELYCRVYFQGDLALPRTIYALATKQESVLNKLTIEVEKRLYELPCKSGGEAVYQWAGMPVYLKQRLANPERESWLAEQFTF